MKTDAKRLSGMREALTRLGRPWTFAESDAGASAELATVWRAYHFRAFADLASSLSAEFRERHAVWPWTKLAGVERLLRQEWFGLDPGLFAAAVEQDVPRLLRLVDQALKELESPLP